MRWNGIIPTILRFGDIHETSLCASYGLSDESFAYTRNFGMFSLDQMTLISTSEACSGVLNPIDRRTASLQWPVSDCIIDFYGSIEMQYKSKATDMVLRVIITSAQIGHD